jgi:hypothetical protein
MDLRPNKPLSISIGISVLLHGLILSSIGDSSVKGQRYLSSISVNIESSDAAKLSTNQSSLKEKDIEDKKLAMTLQQVEHVVDKPVIPVTSDVQQADTRPAGDDLTKAPVQDSPTGMAMPKFIELPWLSGIQVHLNNQAESPQQEPSAIMNENYARQQAMNEMYAKQRAMNEMYAKQQMMVRADALVYQLNMGLMNRVIKNKRALKGSCTLATVEKSGAQDLVCNPSTLVKLLRAEKSLLMDALRLKESAGVVGASLSVGLNNERISVSFQ